MTTRALRNLIFGLLLLAPTLGHAAEPVKVPGFGKMAKWVKSTLARQNRSEVRVQIHRNNRGELGTKMQKSFEASLKKAGVTIAKGNDGFGVELKYMRSAGNRVAMDIALKTKREQVVGKFSSNFTLPAEIFAADTEAVAASN